MWHFTRTACKKIMTHWQMMTIKKNQVYSLFEFIFFFFGTISLKSLKSLRLVFFFDKFFKQSALKKKKNKQTNKQTKNTKTNTNTNTNTNANTNNTNKKKSFLKKKTNQ